VPASIVGEISTPRLLLRVFRDEDRPAFAAMNADPAVMEHFPALLTREESDALAERIRREHASRGFGLWAVELPGADPFVGFVGLSVPSFEAPFTPCVEIGWRLARHVWGRGLATEGARAVLDIAFAELGLVEVLSFTAVQNERSQRVMERIGMTRDTDGDFDHPRLPEGHALRRHVLYRARRDRPRDR